MRETEPSKSPLPSPHGTSDESADDVLHVSSLRPGPHTFSLRRLLNIASVVVAVIAVLALAIHWLPDVVPGRPSQPFTASKGHATPAGWRLIGPAWAQDISFSADGRTGYLCGAIGLGDTPVLVARFNANTVRTNTWRQTTNPATGIYCQIAVSPVNARDVALVVDECQVPTESNCAESTPISQIFRSHDGGVTWTQSYLPAPLAIYGIAWINSTLFLQVWGHLDHDNLASHALNPANALAHLLVSRNDGSFTEIGAEHVVGAATQFDFIALFASGETLYVATHRTPCADSCLTISHTNDAGAHWISYSATYANRPITPAFAQPGSSTIIGWVLRPSDQALMLLRSDDYGAHWSLLPDLPRNPSVGGVTVYATQDGALYVASNGDIRVVYELAPGQTNWRAIALMPTGMPLGVQHDAAGHAVALWGQASDWSYGEASPGLEYYPLTLKG